MELTREGITEYLKNVSELAPAVLYVLHLRYGGTKAPLTFLLKKKSKQKKTELGFSYIFNV